MTAELSEDHATMIESQLNAWQLTGEDRDVGKVLLCAAIMGPNAGTISSVTKLNQRWTKVVCRRLRANGVFKGHRLAVEWYEPETGGIAFMMDVCVGRGLLKRVESK